MYVVSGVLTIGIIIIILLSVGYTTEYSFSQSGVTPVIRDDDLMAELVFNGTVKGITNMAFLDDDDILVLERVNGNVRRVIDGVLLAEPLLDVNVTLDDGLLGIATSENDSNRYVFLYYTESPRGYGNDIDKSNTEQLELVNKTFGYIRECNCLYRYELVDNKLINGKLLLNLPAKPPGNQHHGGEIVVGPDDNVYVVIGDLGATEMGIEAGITKAQNFENGHEPDGRAGILRVTQDGKPSEQGILGDDYPLNLYYAYGIRNSFGMDFDPVTGNLWNTENGPDYGDEINLVEPGFNSGWGQVMGHSNLEQNSDFTVDDLVDFDGKGEYSDPKFTWVYQVGPTAIKFLNSDKLGEEYENDMFVADVNNGYIYHFDLNEDRTELILEGPLEDKIAHTPEEMESTIFAEGFGGGITDLQVGPDGYLYALTDKGIQKILPRTDKNIVNQD